MHVRANSGNPYLRLSRGFCGGKGNLLWREFEDALEEEEMVRRGEEGMKLLVGPRLPSPEKRLEVDVAQGRAI